MLARKRNGNASPKNAGTQNNAGEMYFAETESRSETMRA